MLADLQPINLEVEVCLVQEDSDDCSEGIPKYAEITLTSSFDTNQTYQINESDFDQFGTYNLEIMPGRYLYKQHTLIQAMKMLQTSTCFTLLKRYLHQYVCRRQ